MTKKQALENFKLEYLPKIQEIECRNSGRVDKVMRAEEWNNYTDSLCKSGLITSAQYHNWSNPY